ncbi:hypothetical protein ECFRIK2001_1281, partial [Escherichia coli FRIK2001]|jgi:hypothetical protein
MVNT